MLDNVLIHRKRSAWSEEGGGKMADGTEAEVRSGQEAEAASAQAQPVSPDYVSMTVSSGVAPLEVRFSQINSTYRKLPMAYRMHTYLNSMLEGVLPPEQYAAATDAAEAGLRLAKWNILQAMRTVQAMEKAGRHVEFITARCTAKLALLPDLEDQIRALMEEADFHTPEKLCLEFPQTLLAEDPEQTRLPLLNMRLMKVKTLMSGCGAADCPVSVLLRVPVEYVLLDPHLTALTDNRNKTKAVMALVGYLRSLPAEVIGDGVLNDTQISTLSHADCLGYIPSPAYQGNVRHGRLRMTLDEAISQDEDEREND